MIQTTTIETLPCETHNARPYVCVKSPGCGWCQRRRRCIHGDEHGPTQNNACSYYDNYVFDVPKGFSKKKSSNFYSNFKGSWDPYSYNSNVHWNPRKRQAEAASYFQENTSIDPEISLPGIKFERKWGI